MLKSVNFPSTSERPPIIGTENPIVEWFLSILSTTAVCPLAVVNAISERAAGIQRRFLFITLSPLVPVSVPSQTFPFVLAPLLDLLVIAREQNVWDLVSAKIGRPGV